VAVVVLVQVHAKVSVSVLVNGMFVVFLKNLHEMNGMLLPIVLNAKVVDTDSEQERPPVMFPKAQCNVPLMVAMLIEAFFM
jgi:hypothetical protein